MPDVRLSDTLGRILVVSDAPRRCRDCGREKPAPVIPLGAGSLLADALSTAANFCRWCHCVKLLAGGFEPHQYLLDGFSLEERHEMALAAAKRRAQLQLDWRMRKLERERERTEKEQGTLLAGPSAKREADVLLEGNHGFAGAGAGVGTSEVGPVALGQHVSVPSERASA